MTHREQWRLYIENSLQLMELPDKVKVSLASISSSFFRIAECSVTQYPFLTGSKCYYAKHQIEGPRKMCTVLLIWTTPRMLRNWPRVVLAKCLALVFENSFKMVKLATCVPSLRLTLCLVFEVNCCVVRQSEWPQSQVS